MPPACPIYGSATPLTSVCHRSGRAAVRVAVDILSDPRACSGCNGLWLVDHGDLYAHRLRIALGNGHLQAVSPIRFHADSGRAFDPIAMSESPT